MNDDGQDIVSSINLSGLINKNIETAIDETIDQIDKNGFFTNENDNYVVVTVSSKREEHASRLKERLDRNSEKYGNITTITEAVSEEAVSEAHKMGLSAGKKMMVDRLDSLSNDSIDRKYWNEKSIRDIVREYDRIQELHSSSDTDSDSNTDSNSNIDNDFNMDMNSNTDAKSGDNQDTDEEKNKDVTPAADESGKKPEDIENRTVNDVPDIEKNTNSEYRDSDSKAPEIEQPSKGDQEMNNDHTSPGDNKDPTPPDDASKPTQNPPDNDSPPEPMIP